MSHQTSGNQAKLTRVQLEEHLKEEHKEDKLDEKDK